MINNKNDFPVMLSVFFTVSETQLSIGTRSTAVLSTDLSMAKNQSDVENLVKNCLKLFKGKFLQGINLHTIYCSLLT